MAGFFAVWALAWLPLAVIGLGIARQPVQFPVPPQQKIPLLLSLYALLPGLLWGYAHTLGHTSLTAYGWVWGMDLALGTLRGFLMGVAGVALLCGIRLGAGWSRWQPTRLTGLSGLGTVLALLLTLAISAVEELVFRGFVVHQLGLDSAVFAGLGSCLIFALLHLVWEGPAGWPQLPGLTLMGAVLLLARWSDGGLLGLPCGLHWGWIWSLALLDITGLIVPATEGPAWLAGRPDQPLTSPLVMGLLAGTGLLLWGLP